MANGSSGSMFLQGPRAPAGLLFMQVEGYLLRPVAHFLLRAATASGLGSTVPSTLSALPALPMARTDLDEGGTW